MSLDESGSSRRHMVTPEDAAILERRLRRIMSMCFEADIKPFTSIRTLKNACGDYLEPCPYDWTAMLANGVLT